MGPGAKGVLLAAWDFPQRLRGEKSVLGLEMRLRDLARTNDARQRDHDDIWSCTVVQREAGGKSLNSWLHR